ncbi:MAG: Maf family protein [Tissierellia bacterium]|nr:Maf family protein [Tissierellia bacterium]
MTFTYTYEKNGIRPNYSKYILLSKSPRRRELLSFLNPHVDQSNIDERKIENKFMQIYKDLDFEERASKTCCEIAKAKSDVSLKDGYIYITSDTCIIFEGKIYGKPRSIDEARMMFLSYFGKVHRVVTGVCLRSKDYLEVFYSYSLVKFIDYYEDMDVLVDEYIREENVMDKAGAYGIQDLDPRFIEYISGDINTIKGMPVSELSKRLFKE